MTPERMRSHFFVGDDQRQAAVLVRQLFEGGCAEFLETELGLDQDALNEDAIKQRRDGKVHYADTLAAWCANRRADAGGRRSQVGVTKYGKRLKKNPRQIHHRRARAVLKLLNAAPPEPVGFVNGALKRVFSSTHLVSSPLHGVCARLPVDAGRRAFLYFVSHFSVGEGASMHMSLPAEFSALDGACLHCDKVDAVPHLAEPLTPPDCYLRSSGMVFMPLDVGRLIEARGSAA